MKAYIKTNDIWVDNNSRITERITLTQWGIAKGFGWMRGFLYTVQPQTVEELRSRLIGTMNELDRQKIPLCGSDLTSYASLDYCQRVLDLLIENALAAEADYEKFHSENPGHLPAEPTNKC